MCFSSLLLGYDSAAADHKNGLPNIICVITGELILFPMVRGMGVGGKNHANHRFHFADHEI